MLHQFKNINTILLDVDGVLTDGTLLVMPGGLMVRRMNIKDGYAIQLAVKKGYHVAIISGGDSAEVKDRLQKLGVTDVYMKVHDKLSVLQEKQGTLTLVGELPNAKRPEPLGKPGERLYASRFLGNKGYLVTYRLTDPLYVLD